MSQYDANTSFSEQIHSTNIAKWRFNDMHPGSVFTIKRLKGTKRSSLVLSYHLTLNVVVRCCIAAGVSHVPTNCNLRSEATSRRATRRSRFEVRLIFQLLNHRSLSWCTSLTFRSCCLIKVRSIQSNNEVLFGRGRLQMWARLKEWAYEVCTTSFESFFRCR